MGRIAFRPSPYGPEVPEEPKGKNVGLNKWKPSGDIGFYKYILRNISKVQSFHVGIKGEPVRTLLPGQSVEFEGKEDLLFENGTARLISQGEVEIKVIQERPDPGYESFTKSKFPICKMCGRKISPRNKNGICQVCRKK